MRRPFMLALTLLSVSVISPSAHAVVRLIGITGNQEFNPAADETLYEVNLTNATTTSLLQLTHVPDTDAIGYNPTNGLVYHFSGASSYSNNPGSNGYRDNQYMETVNLDTQQIVPIFNSNPPPSPDSSQSFGLAAPRPDWVLPVDIRLETQNTDEFRVQGPDEYHAVRAATWSSSEGLFYIADEDGLYKVTPSGDSTFVGTPTSEPSNTKGLAFVDVAGQTKLFAGSKNSAFLYELDPLTGQEIGSPLEIQVPPADGFPLEPTGKLLALAAHPETDVLYAIAEPIGADPIADRQLITIDLTTGIGTVLGKLTTPSTDAAFSSLAFVGFNSLAGDFDGDGDADGADFLVWQRGFGDTHDAADFANWTADFGASPAVAASDAASAAVPEPATMITALLALGCLVGVRFQLTKN